jgi:flagellar basal body-associated protein FliL
MSEEATKTEGGGEAAPAAKPKPGMKTMVIVAALMVVEGAAVFGVMSMLGHKPAEAEAKHIEGEAEADEEKLVEVPLTEDKFQNMQTGKVWMWDASIFFQVKKKHQDDVVSALGERAAEVKEGIARIFRRARHNELQEPGLETLNRQLTAFLNETLGPTAEGHPKVVRVLIPKCRGFKTD